MPTVSFLQGRGEQLTRAGQEYRWKRHDSLTVRGNKWYRHSQSKGGGPVDFVMEFFGKSFTEAVEMLTGEKGVAPPPDRPSPAPLSDFRLPPRSTDNRIARNYLTAARRIDEDALISNTKGEGKEGDPFWTKSETLLYCALIAYIIFEGPAEDRNMNTLVDMISGMEVKEDDEDFMNAVDYMFAGLEKRKPDCFAVKQYKKYKLASGVVCSKRLLNQAVRKSLRTHNLKPKKGAQVMRKNEKITALYERLSRDDFGKDDDQQRESNSISNQKAMLEEFAARQGFTNIVHFTDDGISGTCFDRPGFLAMMKEVEAGNVEYLCIKDIVVLVS